MKDKFNKFFERVRSRCSVFRNNVKAHKLRFSLLILVAILWLVFFIIGVIYNPRKSSAACADTSGVVTLADSPSVNSPEYPYSFSGYWFEDIAGPVNRSVPATSEFRPTFYVLISGKPRPITAISGIFFPSAGVFYQGTYSSSYLSSSVASSHFLYTQVVFVPKIFSPLYGSSDLISAFEANCEEYGHIIEFYSPDIAYNNGYTAGYDDGYYSGDYDLGYTAGHTAGYNEGYSSGYNVSQSVGLTNPITVILDPVHSFLDTNLFGNFSIGSAFTVALFVMVAVMFVKMFAGG